MRHAGAEDEVAIGGPAGQGAASFGGLLGSRRFAPLFWCQLLSAFNDNVLKNGLVVLLLFQIGGGGAEMLVSLAGAVFIAPFFLLSGLAGEMADRFDKADMARRLKLAEIAASCVTALGFALHSAPILFAALGLFGVIAALFGPIKYGVLPDLLRGEELAPANALVEAATFLAILAGTIVGGLAVSALPAAWLGALIVGLAVLCWATSLLIPSGGIGAPDLRLDPNILRSTGALVAFARSDGRLWWAGLVTSWFWLVGAVSLALLPALIKAHLHGDEAVATAFMAVFAVGIGTGSALGSRLAGPNIRLWPVAVAAFLMMAFCVDLGLAAAAGTGDGPMGGLAETLGRPGAIRVAVDLGGLALAGGLFVVPPFAAMQAWAPRDRRARAVAAANVLSAAFMVAGALVTAGLQAAGLPAGALFGGLGLACGAVGLAVLRTRPASTGR